MIQCKNCKTEIDDEISVCTVCKYPIKGSEKEQASFIAKQVIEKSEIEEAIGRLKIARTILFLFGGFYLISPFIPFLSSGSLFLLIISMIIGAFFIVCAILSYVNPLIAIGIPLGLTIFFNLLPLLFSPFYLWLYILYSGILWKMIILVGLGYAFISVRRSITILKENKYLASVLGFNKIK